LYKYTDLLRVYITHLLEMRDAATAAAECSRLIGADAALWETWVHKFIEYKQLECIASIVPVDRPRLSSSVYEAVLMGLLGENPRAFLETVKKWGRRNPPLFNHQVLLRTLDQVQKPGVGDRDQRTVAAASYYIEAQAHLYTIAQMYEKAVNCYLDPRIADRIASAVPVPYDKHFLPDIDDGRQEKSTDYRFVFDLIERQNLFKVVSNKVNNLVRLSRQHSAKLLLAHIDKLPIRSVAQQLSADRRLFLWYLHLLFSDPNAREVYSDDQEYADLHGRQVQLYAELMPKTVGPINTAAVIATAAAASMRSNAVDNNTAPAMSTTLDAIPDQVIPNRPSTQDSDLMVFLKSGLAPLDLALQECEKQAPPLYKEMIYILAQMGNQRKALHIHMAECGDVGLAIEFVESQLDQYIGSRRRHGQKLGAKKLVQTQDGSAVSSSAISAVSSGGNKDPSTVIAEDVDLYSSHYVECQLWDDLIEYSLTHYTFLVQLLDYLGMCKLNPVTVISKIPPKAHIPHLKLRLMRILDQLKFQRSVSMRSNALQEEDALNLMRQQNQGQRRAMKVRIYFHFFVLLFSSVLNYGLPLSKINAGRFPGAMRCMLPAPRHPTRKCSSEGRQFAPAFNGNHSQQYVHCHRWRRWCWGCRSSRRRASVGAQTVYSRYVAQCSNCCCTFFLGGTADRRHYERSERKTNFRKF
jgi:hypothetical protein